MKQISQTKLILLNSFFLATFANWLFFTKTAEVYPLNSAIHALYLFSLWIVLVALLSFLQFLIASKYTLKPFAILLFMTSAFSAYFMQTYNVVIDDAMIDNAIQTNAKETKDLLNITLLFYFLLLGAIPSFIVYKLKIEYGSIKRQALNIFLSLLGVLIPIIVFSAFYTSFFREHKPLRYYTNPTFPIYNVGKFIGKKLFPKNTTFSPVGLDASINQHGKMKRNLIIVVVGETARADHFSLNGYTKETNPLLKQEKDLINFPDVTSCGTSTAISVPCMFSFLGNDEGSDPDKARNTGNVLDVLHKVGVNVLWRDNNSDSKGVALRVAFEDFRTNKTNTLCEGEECRDEGMLVGLQEYIQSKKEGDILIVLHQMGNHGPAYYKRYPKAFEKFQPVCKTNQLEKCTKEEINNAYDNAIVYTDTFLSNTIAFLKQNSEFKTAMIYMSDHGESLGENGVYLHGMPKMIAPMAQTKVPMVMWFGDKTKEEVDMAKVKSLANQSYSHENLPQLLLGFFEVHTSLYNESDFLQQARK